VPRGEGLGPLEITITPPGDVDPVQAERYAEQGVSRLNLALPWELDRTGLNSDFDHVVAPLVNLQRS